MKTKSIQIRMYRQGLGDCFLLTLKGGRNDFHILIDCGVLTGTENAGGIMTKVAENIKAVVGRKIDIVIITHEHWDHLSGFHQAHQVFDLMQFGEVWMAWTENPEDELAQELIKEREEKRKELNYALQQLRDRSIKFPSLSSKQQASRLKYLDAVERINSFNGVLSAAGVTSTKEALEDVRKKATRSLYYCYPDRDPIVKDALEGLRFYILGPPRNKALLKKDFSSKEVYHLLFNTGYDMSFFNALYLHENPQSKKNYLYMPFGENFSNKLSNQKAQKLFPDYFVEKNDWRRIDTDWMDIAGQLALALDSDTNNTSLVLAIELIEKRKFLLFTGDAQVGNWLSWYDYKWKVKNQQGKTERIDIKTIFENTVFYKVGHHGSHNATLRDKGLELMTNSELVAMIPVNRSKAVEKGWKMPFDTLLKRLHEKTSGKVILADERIDKTPRPSNCSKSEWSAFISSVNSDDNDLYIDYAIEC